MSRDFQFYMPLRFFQKADAPAGEQRRIAGVISTESRDHDGEVVLQNGLDFSYFLNKGWYNDNHGQKTHDVVGYPTAVQTFRKGDRLPDGSVAQHNCTWAEGHLIPGYEPAEKIWQLGNSLAKSGGARALGFSVEGSVKKRQGLGGKTVAKAIVRNVAITHCPKNGDTRLTPLVKSLQAAALEPAEDLEGVQAIGADRDVGHADAGTDVDKGLSVGTPSPASEQPTEGGRALTRESLEGAPSVTTYPGKTRDDDEKKSKVKKSLTHGEAVEYVLRRYPNLGPANAGRVVELSQRLRECGVL